MSGLGWGPHDVAQHHADDYPGRETQPTIVTDHEPVDDRSMRRTGRPLGVHTDSGEKPLQASIEVGATVSMASGGGQVVTQWRTGAERRSADGVDDEDVQRLARGRAANSEAFEKPQDHVAEVERVRTSGSLASQVERDELDVG